MKNNQEPFTNKLAEIGVLASLLRYKKGFWHEISRIVNSECFTLDLHKIIFKCIAKILENEDSEIDIFTIEAAAHTLNYHNILEKNNGYNYLKALEKEQIERANGIQYSKVIRKLYIAKQKWEKLRLAEKKYEEVTGQESIQQLLNIAEEAAFDNEIIEEDVRPRLIGDGLGDYIKDLMDQELPQLGLSTGFHRYDEAIGGGLQKGNVHCIAARLKSGKSILAKEICYYVAKNGVPSLNIDTEMSREQHMLRLTSSVSGVPVKEIKNGSFKHDKNKKTKVREAIKSINSVPFFHKNVAGFDWDSQISIIKNWLIKEIGLNNDGTAARDCLVVLDYLKVMNAEDISSNMKEHQLLGMMSIGLHNLSIRYNIPILSLAQVNRDGISNETTAIIGDSDRIARYMSSVSLFKDKSDEERQSDGEMKGNKKMVVLAARDGPGTEGNYINYLLEKNLCRITELKSRNEVYVENKEKENGFDIKNIENVQL